MNTTANARALQEELGRRHLEALKSAAPHSAYAFALAHMRTERRQFLSFRDRPYLVDILNDDRPRHVCVACAQSGKTMTYKTKVWWRLLYPGEKARTAIYTFPTKTDVEEFSSARARPMIEASPLLAEQIGDIDNSLLKQFKNGSTIYYRGTFTQRAAISVPADILVHDELDKSKFDTLQMYSDRVRASDDPRSYLFSTPTIPNFGISRAWERSDQREWFWECSGCGEEQCFAPMDRSLGWAAHLHVDDRVFRCVKCQAPVTPEAVRAGRWLAQAPDHADVAGYHITGIMPAMASAARLVADLEEAKFPELWVQGHIGVPEVSGDQEITRDAIVFGDWHNAVHCEERLFAGLDQGKKLDFVAGDGKGRIVAVHRFDDWEQVHSAMRTLNIRMLVADSQPDSRPLQQMLAMFPRRLLLADYSLRTVESDPYEVMHNEPRVRIHRTSALDWTRDQIIMGRDGGDVWPAMAAQAEEVLKSHLTACVRQIQEDDRGVAKAEWIETGPDHLRHAHTYYTIAAAIMGGRKIGISYVRQRPQSSLLGHLLPGQEPQSVKPEKVVPTATDMRGNPVTLTRADRMKANRAAMMLGRRT